MQLHPHIVVRTAHHASELLLIAGLHLLDRRGEPRSVWLVAGQLVAEGDANPLGVAVELDEAGDDAGVVGGSE